MKDNQDKLKKIKDDIGDFFNFFDDNIRNFKKSMRFSFKETITDKERQVLSILKKPEIEVNYTDPYLSRLLGNLSDQSPEPKVIGNGSGDPLDIAEISLYEGHLIDIFNKYEDSGDKDDVVQEQCGGGFSVIRIGTRYKQDSFEQEIFMEKEPDPTLCFFDPSSKKPTKQDGRHCGRVIPMFIPEFKEKYPKFAGKAEDMKYDGLNLNGISWGYKDGDKKILILAEYYCKSFEEYTIYQLSDFSTVKKEDYEEKVRLSDGLVPPLEIIKKRKEKKQVIKRYVIFGEDIIEEEKTSLPDLPLIFVKGKGSFVYGGENSNTVEQVVHSYTHNAMPVQMMLNFMAQTIANFAENLMQQKYMLEQRTVVDLESWTNPQNASVLLWNSKNDDENGEPLPRPEPVQQSDLPSSIMQTFATFQNTMQNTLGSYDAMLGINESSLSGVAIEKGATQNNAVAMPFIKSYMLAMNAAASMIVKMIPLYYVTPMTIPVVNVDGEQQFLKINQRLPDGSPDKNSIQIGNSKSEDLYSNMGVKVTSGYNFAIQKDKALDTITKLSQASPAFSAIANSPKGVSVLIDQLDIRDKDKLKQIANEVENQPKQPSPMEIELQNKQQQLALQQQELAMKQQQMQVDANLKIRQQQIDEQKIATEQLESEIKLLKEIINKNVQEDKVQAEIHNTKVESVTKLADHALKSNEQLHRHTMDLISRTDKDSDK